MSRRFWALVMFLAVLLAAGSASYLYNHLSDADQAPQPVPLHKVAASDVPPAPAVDKSTSVAVAPGAAAQNGNPAPVSAESPEPSPSPTEATSRNILFRLVRPNARKVEILGDFDNWVRKPMKKSGKIWQISLPVSPGRHEYAFVVDGKKIRDPNSRQSGPNGKTSIITVKPLGQHQ